jgi:hypothetical protein
VHSSELIAYVADRDASAILRARVCRVDVGRRDARQQLAVPKGARSCAANTLLTAPTPGGGAANTAPQARPGGPSRRGSSAINGRTTIT